MATFRINPNRRWFVVRTNIKCEQKATDNIRAAGFDVYYPRHRVERQNRRTNTYIVKEFPLMMRYVFVGLRQDDLAFGFVRACEGVECLLGVNGTPIRVPASIVESILDAEINLEFDDTRDARIHRKEEAKTRKETMRMKFPQGGQVEITDGPFSGFQGFVDGFTSRGDIEVLVNLFGRMSPVEMRSSQLQAVA
jgi:transcriptional antiterminator NusG